jgi:hypothetical protein
LDFAYAVKTQLASLRAAKIDAELASAAVKAVEALSPNFPLTKPVPPC